MKRPSNEIQKFFGWLWRSVRRLSLTALLVLAVGVALVFFLTAQARGQAIGGSFGDAVGWATGSFDGITKGIAEGQKAGHAAGLSAEDTEAVVRTNLTELSNLEVLAAGVRLADNHTVGDTYAALYIIKGTAVFTVDLGQADVSGDGTQLTVVLPNPECDLRIDEEASRKLASYQRPVFNGASEDGFDAYINSMKQIEEKGAETLSNYSDLIKQAKESARKEVTLLAKSAAGTSLSVSVLFEGEAAE